jgi:ubiquinone/menaquinone biosynthesis C-methylase UbiE
MVNSLQKRLICPVCHGELDFGQQAIVCTACGTHYPVHGRIPVMTVGPSDDGFGHDLYNAQVRGNVFEKVFHRGRIRTLLKLIVNELDIGTPWRVLDVGCNTGPMVIPLRRRGYDVTGIDISATDVHQAERYLDELGLPDGGLAVADGTRLPFPDRSFDLVLLIDVLEHTDHPQRVVDEAKRLLSPGGTVVATVPWAYHPLVRHDWMRKLLSSRKTIDEHPDAPFKRNMLQALFGGFQPVLFRHVFHWVCLLGVYRLAASQPARTAVPVRIDAGEVGFAYPQSTWGWVPPVYRDGR